MSIRENLIKARALIDTAEKWHEMPVKMAVWYASGEDHKVASEMDDCLRKVNVPRNTHEVVMELFDRAIEASE